MNGMRKKKTKKTTHTQPVGSHQGMEAVINQAPTTQLARLTAGVLTPGQSAARARRKHARGRPRRNRGWGSRWGSFVPWGGPHLVLARTTQKMRLRNAEERWEQRANDIIIIIVIIIILLAIISYLYLYVYQVVVVLTSTLCEGVRGHTNVREP